MPVFLCRWPNGDVSIISARNKSDAIYYLDELANAESAEISQLHHFLIDFKLEDDGTLTFNQWGERTEDELMKKAYPELDRTLRSEALSGLKEDSPEYQAMINRAVEAERQRLRGQRKKVREPKTHLGKQLKKVADAPTSVIDRIVEDTSQVILKKYRPRGPVH